jgi:hypothetical protein
MRALVDSLFRNGIKAHVLTNYYIGAEECQYCFSPKDSALAYDKWGYWIGFIYRAYRKLVYLALGINYHPHYKQFINRYCSENDYKSISAIIVSTPQPECIDVGVSLSLHNKCKLVLDFRDGLTYEPLAKTNFVSRFINERIERRGIKHADLVISVSDAITEDFKNKYPTTKTKYITITNGYLDEGSENKCESSPLEPYIDDSKINIVFSGNIGLSRKSIFLSLQTFSYAMKLLTQKERDSLNISFIGKFLPREKLLISSFGITYPPVSRVNIRKIQANSDYLLLLTGPDRSVVTMKLFDYLAARRPILAIGNAPTPKRILEETNAGCQFSLDQQDDIARMILSFTKTKILSDEPIQKYRLDFLMDTFTQRILEITNG